MSRKTRTTKQKYMCLATALLLVGKLFGRLKNRAPLVPRPGDIWPKDSTFSRRWPREVTGFDVFARDMYRKPRVGESHLGHYAQVYRRWEHELDADTRERYEAMAQDYNTRHGSRR